MVDPCASDLTIEVSEAVERTVVGLHGEFDLCGEPHLYDALENAIALDQPTVVIDLRGLTFIDSSGIRALLVAARRCQETAHVLHVVPGPPQVANVLRLCGVDDQFACVEAPEAVPTARV
jgi:anti-sigma B factor antagonist